MAHVVIVGAGPIGLYLAYQLIEVNCRDIVLIDPRAGSYVRPGHIGGPLISAVNKAVHKDPSEQKKLGHIKDIERILYEELTKTKVVIERKKFVQLQRAPQKGVIVQNEMQEEELIECDYVFDCTGSKRELIQNINSIENNPPFTINHVVEHNRVKQHLLSYIHMSLDDFNLIKKSFHYNFTFNFFANSQHFIQVNEKFRHFGWKEFGLPQLQGVYFGKEKVCLYCACPDNLPKNLYEPWLKLVIDVLTSSTHITLSQLPSSKKYAHKPRLSSFTVDPKIVRELSFVSADLPTIIPLGDSQIETNPSLGQGISEGMKRVDTFINNIQISEGRIDLINLEQYTKDITPLIQFHEHEIIKENQAATTYYNRMMTHAESYFTEALAKENDSSQLLVFTNFLKETRARLAYFEALELLAPLFQSQSNPFFHQVTDQSYGLLMSAEMLINQVITNLPATTFASEYQHSLALYLQIASALKFCADSLQAGEGETALIIYNDALTIYKNPALASQQTAILEINLQILKTYQKLNSHLEVVNRGIAYLKEVHLTDAFMELKKKLLFSVIFSLRHLLVETPSTSLVTLCLLKQRGKNLVKNYGFLLEAIMIQELTKLFSVSEHTSYPFIRSNNPFAFMSYPPESNKTLTQQAHEPTSPHRMTN